MGEQEGRMQDMAIHVDMSASIGPPHSEGVSFNAVVLSILPV